MSEEELINKIKTGIYKDFTDYDETINKLLDLYNKEKEKAKYYENQNKIKGRMLNKSLNELKESCISKDKIRELRNIDNIDLIQFKLIELLEE